MIAIGLVIFGAISIPFYVMATRVYNFLLIQTLVLWLAWSVVAPSLQALPPLLFSPEVASAMQSMLWVANSFGQGLSNVVEGGFGRTS